MLRLLLLTSTIILVTSVEVVAQDDDTFVLNETRAKAEQGDAQYQTKLGYNYEIGRGVEKNYLHSHGMKDKTGYNNIVLLNFITSKYCP